MIADLLEMQRPGGPWVLCALAGKGDFPGQQFDDADKASAWAVKQNRAKRNVYFVPNEVRPGVNKKPSRAEIARVDWIFVDIDPAPKSDWGEEHERIKKLVTEGLAQKGIPTPTLVIDSGGGWQLGFKLRTPIDVTADPVKGEEVERIAKAMIALLDGDKSCFSIDHVYRLPGTTNYASQEKLKKQSGRPAEREAEVWSWTREPDGSLRTYVLADFAPLVAIREESAPRPRANREARPLANLDGGKGVGVDELRAWAEANRTTIPDHTLALVATGADPIDPQRYPSRSEALFRAVCDLVRADVPDEMIFGAITDPNNGISESVREQRGWQGYAQRQIENARAACADPTLEEMNRLHAVLLQEGGKTRVLSWERTELDEDRLVPVLQSFEDFRNRYMHRLVEYPTDKGVGYKPLGKWWLEHAKRREYLALRFLPAQPGEVDGYLNLWRGWSVTPKPGDWSLMREHVRRVLANGDETCTDYILHWAAWAIQNPGEPAEVALVLRGGRGTGKGIFARTLRRLFGQHGLQVNSPSQLTGRFNAHLRDCCLLFADEAIVPGDKAAESVLKGLITEPELTIEGKGVNLVQARNRLHVVMASNEEWVVPAGIDERRFAVFEVSSAHAQDSDYFRAIAEQLRGGGLAAMLYDLLTMDLADWHPRRNVPQTEALHAQKAATVGGIDAVFLDLLRSGEIPASSIDDFGNAFVATSALRDYAQRHLRREDVTLNAVNKLLRDLGFEYKDSRPRGFALPPLPASRAAWDRVRMPMRWDGVTRLAQIESERYGKPPF